MGSLAAQGSWLTWPRKVHYNRGGLASSPAALAAPCGEGHPARGGRAREKPIPSGSFSPLCAGMALIEKAPGGARGQGSSQKNLAWQR